MLNPQQSTQLQEAITLANNNRKYEAYQMLKPLEASQDVLVLCWLAFVTPNQQEAFYQIEQAARLEPANPVVLNAQSWLASQRMQQAPPLPQPYYVPVIVQERRTSAVAYIAFTLLFLIALCSFLYLVSSSR